ncbi:Na+/H+ antiporter subunit E [Sphingomonas sp. ac-8]|uniref:Na+/H+ antiporter subunit E n=1 Tax=Sphingomonas sp. ac-8 TaxID=3242977 RepID=UPI003A80743E
MSRLLPHPVLTLALLAMWLLLQQSLSLGQILLGSLVAVIAARGFAALRPTPGRIRFGRAMLRLIGIVLIDIVRSNLAVGRIVLLRPANRKAGFLRIPLDLTNRHGLATLAIITTATPGTLWVQHDAARNLLLLHILDLTDEDYWIRLIKGRYERLLMEVFV